MKPVAKLFPSYSWRTLCAFTCAVLLGLGTSFASLAQKTTYADDYWLDWEEDAVTSIPDFDPQKSIEVEVDPRSQLRWFVDPATISIGEDSVVRYVIIGTSRTGTMNAMYEGILCAQGTYKTYARAIQSHMQNPIPWRIMESPQWRNLDDATPFSHERILARTYMCDGNSRPHSVNDIVRTLRRPYNHTNQSR